MNILLTASFKNGVFCNGLQQNIVFLCELLKNIGHNPIICLNHKIKECVDPPNDILVIEEQEILKESLKIDIALQTGWVISNQIIDALKQKNRIFKNIHIHYGNRLLADVEQCKWDTVCVPNYKVDEIWVSPHYEFSIPYFKTYYNTNSVKTLPYIWSPKYIQAHEDIWNKTGKSCKYSPLRPKNIAVLEPNLNLTKNCIPSIFCAEELINKEGEDIFNKLVVYCTSSIIDKRYFKGLMKNINLTKKSKVIFQPRIKISKVFSHDCNLVISHQLLNGLNYTYLEDTQLGAAALKEALTCHDENLIQYEIKSKELIYKYSPENPIVIEKYKKLLS